MHQELRCLSLGDSSAPKVSVQITHWYSTSGCAALDSSRWLPSQFWCQWGMAGRLGSVGTIDYSVYIYVASPAWCSQSSWSSYVKVWSSLEECSKRPKSKLHDFLISSHLVLDSMQCHASATL